MIRSLRKFCWFIMMLFLTLTARAQKGNNQIQIAAQYSLPTGDLGTVAKIGYGYSAKGLWGLGSAAQQITLEVNNNFFDVKDKYVVPQVKVNYASWPIYAGYRRYLKSYFVEGQVGVAFNQITAFRTDRVIASGTQNNQFLAWAFGVGYCLKYFEFGTRYQLSTIKNNSDITFIAFRLAYRLPFYKNSKFKKDNDLIR